VGQHICNGSGVLPAASGKQLLREAGPANEPGILAFLRLPTSVNNET
jgi:hypothetical protein